VSRASIVGALYDSRRHSQPFDGDGVVLDVVEGLSVQLEVAARFEAAGESIGGWKVGMTSGRSHDRMGEAFRPHGYVLASHLLDSGAQLRRDDLVNPGIEPELCLILGEPLSGSPSQEEARAAVVAVAAAFEVIELRLPGGGGADNGLLVADGLANWGIVVGPSVPPPASLPAGLEVTLSRDGAEVARERAGGTVVFDDPFLSLAWLAVVLSRSGCSLEVGQPVITGSFANVELDGPGRWRAVFSGVGAVELDVV
jgi:2-keto-4-pentenoate hydratase